MTTCSEAKVTEGVSRIEGFVDKGETIVGFKIITKDGQVLTLG